MIGGELPSKSTPNPSGPRTNVVVVNWGLSKRLERRMELILPKASHIASPSSNDETLTDSNSKSGEPLCELLRRCNTARLDLQVSNGKEFGWNSVTELTSLSKSGKLISENMW